MVSCCTIFLFFAFCCVLTTVCPTELKPIVPKEYQLLHLLSDSDVKTFSALNCVSSRKAIVKVSPWMKAYQLQNEQYVLQKFLAECPYVAKVVHYEHTGTYIIVVEEPLGTPLDEYWEHLPSSNCNLKLLQLASQLVEGLKSIHGCSVLHRDIKPQNIIITDEGLPLYIDFGLSVTIGALSQGFVGTRDFASENALAARNPTPEDDFISLCYTLYSLEIGFTKWHELGHAGQRPKYRKLCKSSAIVQNVRKLWRSRRRH